MAPASELSALLTAITGVVHPVRFGNFPRASEIAAAQLECDWVVQAAAAFVRSRMDDVERHTGTAMEGAERASFITAAFDDNCRGAFGVAEDTLRDAAPSPRIYRQQPGAHGRAA